MGFIVKIFDQMNTYRSFRLNGLNDVNFVLVEIMALDFDRSIRWSFYWLNKHQKLVQTECKGFIESLLRRASSIIYVMLLEKGFRALRIINV